MTSSVEQLLMYVFSVCMSSSKKCLLSCLCNFKVTFCFSFQNYMCSYKSDRRPLSNKWLGNSSWSGALVLNFLMVSLEEQMLQFFFVVICSLIFSSFALSFVIVSKDLMTNSKSGLWLFSCVFYSKNFMVLSFKFQSLIHLVLFSADHFSWSEAGVHIHYFCLVLILTLLKCLI